MSIVPPYILQNSDCIYDPNGLNVVTLDCIPIIFANLIFFLLVFAGIAAVIFIIFGGVKFLTSGGDPKQVEGARKTITWAIIGLVLILMSFMIVRTIGEVTGVTCINKFGFDNCKDPNDTTPPENYTPPGEGGEENVTCDPATHNKYCPTGRSCVCVPKTQKEICNYKGLGMVCSPINPRDCSCVPKNWPTCSFLNRKCGPDYQCDTSQKKCVVRPGLISCTCNTEGGLTGSNGYTCNDGTGISPSPAVYCSEKERCMGTSKPPCAVTYTCAHEGQPADQNYFVGTDNPTKNIYCADWQVCTGEKVTNPNSLCKNVICTCTPNTVNGFTCNGGIISTSCSEDQKCDESAPGHWPCVKK
jgi:hypothetical protein